MTVQELDSKHESGWDAYVRSHRWGSPFHLLAWQRVIKESFSFQPLYQLALSEGRIRGVLPLFLVHNPLMGKVLLSSPFAVYGGPLADDREVTGALAERAGQLGYRLGAEYVEFRNRDASQCAGWNPVSRYVNFTQALTPDEQVMLEAIPRKTRYIIRKSFKNSFASRTAANSTAFQQLYAENLQRLGTPCFPSHYFESLARHFGSEMDVTEVVQGNRVVAAVLTLYFGGCVYPYYGAADNRLQHAAPSSFLYFDQMRRCAQQGYTDYDFGRSKRDSGSYHFKAHWGMRETSLPYEIQLIRRKQLPNFSPQNPRFHLAIRIWQMLPSRLARWLGPRLVKLVP
jgi:FemAB-related protein (PEP-CTERM system-associated)